MKTVNLLLGNCDRRINNLLEIAVRDVCYNQAVVECFRTSRLDELLQLSSSGRYQLIFIAPENLKPAPSRRPPFVTVGEVLRAMRTIRSRCSTPMIAVGVSEEHEVSLLEAGAENTFALLFDVEALKAEVRRVLRMSELVKDEEPPAGRGLIETWVRRFSFLKSDRTN